MTDTTLRKLTDGAFESRTMIIRPAGAADRDAIVELMRRGFADEQERGYPATTAQQIEQTLQNEGSFVGVDDNGKLVGFVWASNRAERDGSRIISMLVVDPALEGKGHGRRLTDAAENYMRRTGCARIKITVLNFKPERTFRLYRERGYQEVDRSDVGTRSNGDYFVIMKKSLVDCES